MPKPLTDFLPSKTSACAVEFLTTQLTEHPLSRYVLATISYWSHTDLTIMCLGTRFLQADFAIAYEMLRSLKAENARMDAIKGAAAAFLDEKDYRLYDNTMSAVRPSKKQRHKFAHHIIGQTSLIPDSLLLVDPKTVGKKIYNQSGSEPQSLNDGNLGWEITTDDAIEEIDVYLKDELVKIAETAKQCEHIVNLLHLALGQGERRDQSRVELLAHPLFQPYIQNHLDKS